MIPLGILAALAAGGGGGSTALAAITPFTFSANGTVSITVSGETRTPTAVEFWYGKAATLGAEAAHIYMGVGISDDITEYSLGVYGEDAVSTTNDLRRGNTTAMFLPNSQLSATVNGFKSGGCDLSVSTVSGTVRGIAIFYFADAAEVVVNGYTTSTSVNGLGSVNFTDAVGVVRAVCGAAINHTSDASDRCLSVGGGVGTTSGVTGQVCMMISADDARTNSKREHVWRTDCVGSTYLNENAQGDYSLDGFGSSGIDTTAYNRSGGTRYVGFLLLKFPSGTNVWAGEIAAPPSSGDWEAVSGGIGFIPDIALGIGSHTDNAADNKAVEYVGNNETSVMSLFAVTETDAGCVALRQGDGNPVQDKTLVSAQPMLWSYGGAGGNGVAYDISSASLTTKFLETGAININTAQATPRKMVGMAIG